MTARKAYQVDYLYLDILTEFANLFYGCLDEAYLKWLSELYKMTRIMAISKIDRHLMTLGFSKEESAVYIALLGMGSGSISDLAKRTSLHRSKTGETLEKLQVLGIVSSVLKGKRTLFLPEHPEGLRNIITRQSASLEELLPQLTERFVNCAPRPVVRLFSGKVGITEVYQDLLRSLKKGEVFFRYESPEDYKAQDQYLPRAYFTRVCESREIEKYVITNDITSRKKPKQLERSTRVVPPTFDLFVYNITQIIYGNKVAFIDFTSEIAWMIENERFATFQRQLFRLLHERL